MRPSIRPLPVLLALALAAVLAGCCTDCIKDPPCCKKAAAAPPAAAAPAPMPAPAPTAK
jgi:hypothetical protein